MRFLQTLRSIFLRLDRGAQWEDVFKSARKLTSKKKKKKKKKKGKKKSRRQVDYREYLIQYLNI